MAQKQPGPGAHAQEKCEEREMEEGVRNDMAEGLRLTRVIVLTKAP